MSLCRQCCVNMATQSEARLTLFTGCWLCFASIDVNWQAGIYIDDLLRKAVSHLGNRAWCVISCMCCSYEDIHSSSTQITNTNIHIQYVHERTNTLHVMSTYKRYRLSQLVLMQTDAISRTSVGWCRWLKEMNKTGFFWAKCYWRRVTWTNLNALKIQKLLLVCQCTIPHPPSHTHTLIRSVILGTVPLLLVKCHISVFVCVKLGGATTHWKTKAPVFGFFERCKQR